MSKCIRCNYEGDGIICGKCLNNWSEMRGIIWNTLVDKMTFLGTILNG